MGKFEWDYLDAMSGIHVWVEILGPKSAKGLSLSCAAFPNYYQLGEPLWFIGLCTSYQEIQHSPHALRGYLRRNRRERITV